MASQRKPTELPGIPEEVQRRPVYTKTPDPPCQRPLCYENHLWTESGRRLSSGPATTGNRYQIAVRIQWTTSQPSKSVFFVFFCSFL